MNSLTDQEQKELVRLMNKLSFPMPLAVFEARCRVFGTVCAEVVVIKNRNKDAQIFLTYRDDKFFKGWHIPGRVCLPTEKISDTTQRVCKEEIKMKTGKKIFFNWFERPFGSGIGKSPRGHEFSFVFLSELKGKVKEKTTEKFFSLKNLPKDLLLSQKPIIKELLSIKLSDCFTD